MQLKHLIQLAALVNSAVALPQPVHAHHHHHLAKREPDVVTVYVTQTYAGTTVVDANAPTGTPVISVVNNEEVEFQEVTPAVAAPAVPLSSSGTTVVPLATTTSTAADSTPEYSAAASSAGDTATSSSTAAAGSVEYYAEMAQGITYSPYTDSGSCKDASTIQSDVQKLSSFDVIRVYAPDCSCIENILAAKTSSQKIFAGLYYMDTLSTDIDTLATQIATSSESWDAVYAVSVGNEWVNAGTYSVSQVSAAVSSARSLLSSAGYSGSVVTVDTLVAYQSNTDLCEISDFIAVNSHPFWDGNTVAADSGSFLETQIANIYADCGSSKKVVVCETGWPTAGSDYGVAVPSVANQLTAIQSIAESSIIDQVFMFTMYNDYWKAAGDYGVEQSWGIFD